MVKKIYAYGMDGFITPMMKFFAAEGTLPNFSRFLREGTVNQTHPAFSMWTPTNWATFSNGAHRNLPRFELADHRWSKSRFFEIAGGDKRVAAVE